MTESELREEIIARHDAERRLKNAEDSLARLDSALKESRPEPVTKQEKALDVEIFTNVAHLKSKLQMLFSLKLRTKRIVLTLTAKQ